MCGIAGYFGTRVLPEDRIQKTLQLMRRRGPDNASYCRWQNRTGRNVYFLHARLDIIDLSDRANQPLGNDSTWISYNGELYNYLEVRADLRARGHQFKTDSDTEVLLTALQSDGPGALDRCEGMWAFATFDQRTGSVLLSRDRFGEKPLYLYRDETGLYFGSEAKFIFALLGRRLPVNYDHLYRFLVNGYKALYKTPASFFVGLQELPPATVLTVSEDGRESAERYWCPQVQQDPSIDYVEAVKGTRDRLIRAVELRLRADVPLAFCMSGGVDSNALLAIAKRVFDYDVHGFTITSTDERYDEQDLVEYAVGELGIRHNAVRPDPGSFLSGLQELVKQHDAPVYTITYYAHWLLMKSIAAQGYRIAVSGTAADELFTGYYDHHLAYLYEVRNLPDLYERSRAAWLEHIRPIVRNPFLQDPDAFVRNPGMRDHIYLNAEGFGEYLRQDWTEPFEETVYSSSLLRNRMLNEIFHEAVPVILHEDDLNAMYFSIENRSPYLDRHLFEYAHQIPSAHLIRDGRAKAILRDSMQGIVPDRIIENRRKVGFNAPIFSYLDVADPKVRETLLGPSPVWDHVRRDRIVDLIEKPYLPNSESKFLFYFVTTKLFLEEFAA